MKNYICHSGGCPGADMTWEEEGKQYGVKTIAYSFPSHTQYGENQYTLTPDELLEGWKNILIADESLKRNVRADFTANNPYIRNLLSRNWFQVKNSEAVFAVGRFQNHTHTKVNGGTGWAVQMAIDNKKEVYFFNQKESDFGSKNHCWFQYNYYDGKFNAIDGYPTLTENFAGIGSRELNAFGTLVIKDTYKYNFKL